MTSSCCPIYTNKTKILYLNETRYPGEKDPYWGISAEEVRTVIENGQIPEFRLPEKHRVNPRRPLIAVLLAVAKHPDRMEKDYAIHPSYVHAVERAGGRIAFVAFDKVKEQLEFLNPDGIILPGGDFFFPPEKYVDPQNHQGEIPGKRYFAYEKALTFARRRKFPLVGICAGFQVLALLNGGKLRNKINKTAAAINHRQDYDLYIHNVEIKPDTLLANITGLKSVKVNSTHNEAVVPQETQDFIITATAPDDVPEALELRRPWNEFVLGVQWHPEKLVKFEDPAALALFEKFVSAAKVYQKNKLVEVKGDCFIVDMMYALPQNMVSCPVYEKIGFGNRALVHKDVWKCLKKLEPVLKERKLKLKIRDAYRPPRAHRMMKEIIPAPGFFASSPEASQHCHGTAVDVVLCDLEGNELEFPTRVDAYDPRYAEQVRQGETASFLEHLKTARHDYEDPSRPVAMANRKMLREMMEAAGFQAMSSEWWHYDLPDGKSARYPLVG